MSTTPLPTQIQYDSFTKELVQAMYGIHFDSFKEEKKDQVAKQCTAIYEEFMLSYFRENYTETDYYRVQQAKTQPDIFTKFPDLSPKFLTAYAEFVKQLELNPIQ